MHRPIWDPTNTKGYAMQPGYQASLGGERKDIVNFDIEDDTIF